MNANLIQGVVSQALLIAAKWFPPAAIGEPLVSGIIAAIVDREPVPVPEGETWTPEQIQAYRAEVLAKAQALLGKIDLIAVLAAENIAQALADLAAEAAAETTGGQ